MDLLWTLLLALPTIFLAAFLAAALENFRERRRTRSWVMRNLQDLVGRGRFDTMVANRAALRQWLDAESAGDIEEEAWRRAWFVSVSSLPDLSPLLRSEAATSVPAEVFGALRDLDAAMTINLQIESYANELFGRDVAPLWYERRVPLSGADRRRVELFVQVLDRMDELQDEARQAHARLQSTLRDL